MKSRTSVSPDHELYNDSSQISFAISFNIRIKSGPELSNIAIADTA